MLVKMNYEQKNPTSLSLNSNAPSFHTQQSQQQHPSKLGSGEVPKKDFANNVAQRLQCNPLKTHWMVPMKHLMKIFLMDWIMFMHDQMCISGCSFLKELFPCRCPCLWKLLADHFKPKLENSVADVNPESSNVKNFAFVNKTHAS